MLKDITLSALWSAMVELPEIVNPSLLECNFRIQAWINKKYKVLLKDTKKTNHPMMIGIFHIPTVWRSYITHNASKSKFLDDK